MCTEYVYVHVVEPQLVDSEAAKLIQPPALLRISEKKDRSGFNSTAHSSICDTLRHEFQLLITQDNNGNCASSTITLIITMDQSTTPRRTQCTLLH